MDADRKMNRYIARIEKKALEKGIALGKAEGRIEGRIEGRAEGKAEALAEKARPMQTVLLYLLEVRFGEVTDPVRSRVLNITDAGKILDVANAARKLDGIDELERLLSSSS